MKRFFSGRLAAVTIVVLILILTQLIFFERFRDGARDILSQPTSFFSSLTNSLRSSISLWRNINNLSQENILLRQQNNDLTAQVAELKTVAIENSQLKKDLDFKNQNQQFQLLPTNILGSSLGTSFQVFTISKGSDDGIKEGQAVVTQGFLIGRIKSVAPNSAEVWQISNRNQLTPVILTTSQATGILKGGIRGLVIENIPVNYKVEKDEYVVTSALEGLYPAGILIGKVEDIISRKEDIFLTVRVSTPINISTVSTVFVIINN